MMHNSDEQHRVESVDMISMCQQSFQMFRRESKYSCGRMSLVLAGRSKPQTVLPSTPDLPAGIDGSTWTMIVKAKQLSLHLMRYVMLYYLNRRDSIAEGGHDMKKKRCA